MTVLELTNKLLRMPPNAIIYVPESSNSWNEETEPATAVYEDESGHIHIE